jgi:hypothetical protein
MTTFPNSLPHWLSQLLNNPPSAGNGVHRWLYKTSRQLHAHFPTVEILKLLKQASTRCGRRVSDREIIEAIRSSVETAWIPSGAFAPVPPTKKWPAVDLTKLRAIIDVGAGLPDLWEASPVLLGDNLPHTEEIIDTLFPSNPLLCCGWSISQFATRSREDWRGQLSQLSLIVPSEMTAPTGRTKDGKESSHCLGNTGPRRFLVVEFDFAIYTRDGKTETQFAPLIRKRMDRVPETDDKNEIARERSVVADMGAAILLHLAGYAPLALAVHSGGKSLHGWFRVFGDPEEKVLRFFRYAVSLGADPATWTRSQFVRMPDGLRDNGKRQTVFFFNL